MIIKGIVDEKQYDWRKRKKKWITDKGYNLFLVFSGRNLGKTTNIYRTEFQQSIAQYKNNIEPETIGIIIRTEKTWQKIKKSFLDNLKKEPFNMSFEVEGNSLWYVRPFEKIDKDGMIVHKYKREFKLADIFFLWSSNSYKLANFEKYRCMVFDEIIPEFEGYIPQEISKFETLISTFSRLNSSKYVVGICNSITNSSPYFEYIGVGADEIPEEGETFINPQKKAILEYAPQTDYVRNLQENSTAGKLLQGGDYYKMVQGQLLRDENYFILSKPSGEYHPKYNFFIEGESFIVNQYSKSAYWISMGNQKEVKNYYGDKYSATKNGSPWEFIGNDWIVNDLKTKLSKGRLWFREVESREIFIEFIKKNF